MESIEDWMIKKPRCVQVPVLARTGTWCGHWWGGVAL